MILLGQFVAVELMKTGTWDAQTGRVSIKRDLLQSVVENYASLRDTIDIPLKLGHAERTNMLPKGMPAAGWVSNLRLRDDGKGEATLLADIETVSKQITELIRRGAYRHLSVEIHAAFSDGRGKTYKNVLTGLALLGAELPAVKGLKSITESFLDREKKVAATDGATDGSELIILTHSEKTLVSDHIRTLLGLPENFTAEEKAAALWRLHLHDTASDEEIINAAATVLASDPKNARPEAEGEPAPEPESAPESAPEGDEGEDPEAEPEAAPEPEEAPESGPEAELAANRAEVAELRARLDQRDAQDRTTEIEGIVASAVEAGTILPACRDEFVSLGEAAGPEKLRQTLAKLPPVIAFGEIGSAGSSGDRIELSAEERDMARRQGLNERDLINGERIARGFDPLPDAAIS